MMRYTWDEEKAAENKRKHHVSFEAAALALADPNKIEDYDGEHSESEDRWSAIGLADIRMLFVVYVERVEGVSRIVSARKATKNERKAYYQINSRP